MQKYYIYLLFLGLMFAQCSKKTTEGMMDDAQTSVENAAESLLLNQFSDSIYYSNSSIVNTAKALLISEGKSTNTHAGIISQFDEVFASKINLEISFSDFIYQIQNNSTL